jgi:hypothetical protein
MYISWERVHRADGWMGFLGAQAVCVEQSQCCIFFCLRERQKRGRVREEEEGREEREEDKGRKGDRKEDRGSGKKT